MAYECMILAQQYTSVGSNKIRNGNIIIFSTLRLILIFQPSTFPSKCFLTIILLMISGQKRLF